MRKRIERELLENLKWETQWPRFQKDASKYVSKYDKQDFITTSLRRKKRNQPPDLSLRLVLICYQNFYGNTLVDKHVLLL